MAAFELFRVAFFIISVHYISGLPASSGTGGGGDSQSQDNCDQQTTYSLTNLDALAIDLYYDAGFLDPDTVFIQSMCKARECFTTVTFTFHVGVCLEKDDDGNLKCSNADESSTDCTNAFKDVCASQLVPCFDDYLCCLYYSDESMTPEQCVQNQNVDMDEFNNCVNLQDPNISPVDILVQNSDAAFAKFNDPNALPFLSFNGQNDVCARDAFYDDPEAVICAMLAQGVEESCNVGNSNQ